MLIQCIIISLCIPFVCVAVSCVISSHIAQKNGKSIAKVVRLKKESFFERIFFKLPFQIVADMYNHADYEFTENGLHLIVGEQGTGKTITLVYLLMRYKRQFPELKIRSNMKYAFEDGAIKNWKDLVFRNNGVFGEIDVIDEIQNWFNSLESKDFPVEMFQEITQQRKQRKMIIGTSQVWQRVAKPIREQVKLVYEPRTYFGCLTVVRISKPVINDDGSVEKLLPRGMFFFVHDDDIRNAFDTYHKIQVMSLKGFKEQKGNPYSYAEPTAPSQSPTGDG